jgi:hypothetical protein
VLDVSGRDRLERDPQLLEDVVALRRRGRKDQPWPGWFGDHGRLRTTQISSLGHRRAHPAVTKG